MTLREENTECERVPWMFSLKTAAFGMRLGSNSGHGCNREWHWRCGISSNVWCDHIRQTLPDTHGMAWAYGAFRAGELSTTQTRRIPTQRVSETTVCSSIESFVAVAAVATAHRAPASLAAPSIYTHNNLHTKQTASEWNLMWWVQCMFSYRYKRNDLIIRVCYFSSPNQIHVVREFFRLSTSHAIAWSKV